MVAILVVARIIQHSHLYFLVCNLFFPYLELTEAAPPMYSAFTLCMPAAAAKSLQLCPTLCDPIDGSPPGSSVPGFSRQEHWSGLPFPSPMHESEKWKWSHLVMPDSSWPHGLQPTRLLRPWDFPGKSTRVGCHRLLRVYAYLPFKTQFTLQFLCEAFVDFPNQNWKLPLVWPLNPLNFLSGLLQWLVYISVSQWKLWIP